MLNEIKIKGYKSIKDLSLELKPINILIGANGVGKTNFISFFRLVNNIYEQRLQNYTMQNRADGLLYYGIKRTKEITGYLSFSSNAYSFTLQPRDNGSMFIAREDSWYEGSSYGYANVDESCIKKSTTFRDKWLRDYLQSYKIYHFHDTSKGAPLRSVADVNDIMPYFERFDLEPQALDNKIELVWNDVQFPDKYFAANDLSDGSIRFIALTTLLLQPNLPKVIIIDEPELGLHPVAITKLAGMIKSAAARGCQMIISTQSVSLINQFDADNIITVDRKDGQSVFNRLDKNTLESWLENYSIGELWTKSIINGQPAVL